MKKSDKQTLNKIRKKINSIDKQIIDLLRKRSYLIPKVRTIKNNNLNYKIAFNREIDIANKITQSDFGLYDNTFMQKIWRELISATLKIECNLNITIYKTKFTYKDLWETTKDHFGINTNFSFNTNRHKIYENLLNKSTDMAIMPYFDAKSFWWIDLCKPQYKEIKINLILPYFKEFKTLNNTKSVCISLNNDDIFRYQKLYILKFNYKIKNLDVNNLKFNIISKYKDCLLIYSNKILPNDYFSNDTKLYHIGSCFIN